MFLLLVFDRTMHQKFRLAFVISIEICIELFVLSRGHGPAWNARFSCAERTSGCVRQVSANLCTVITSLLSHFVSQGPYRVAAILETRGMQFLYWKVLLGKLNSPGKLLEVNFFEIQLAQHPSRLEHTFCPILQSGVFLLF